MIARLIEEYKKQGGREPLGILVGSEADMPVPEGVFVVVTPLVGNWLVVVLPLTAAIDFVHGSLSMEVEDDGKE